MYIQYFYGERKGDNKFLGNISNEEEQKDVKIKVTCNQLESCFSLLTKREIKMTVTVVVGDIKRRSYDKRKTKLSILSTHE